MTAQFRPATREELIRSYNLLVGGIEEQAVDDDRAYGGVIRAAKGKLVEEMTPHIIRLAWQNCGGEPSRISFGDVKTYPIHIQQTYVDLLDSDVKAHINAHKDEYFYRAKVDRHIFVDHQFVMGVECKTYTENAMLKRILVDFRLLRSRHTHLICCLLQLESQLGGDYGDPLSNIQLGSASSHTLMSHFPEVELNILTLLEGERKVDRPIHQPEYFKELLPESLDRTIRRFSELLAPLA